MSSERASSSFVKNLFILLGCALFVTLAAGASTAVVDLFLPRGAPSPFRWLVPVLTGSAAALLSVLAWLQYARAHRRQRGLTEQAAEVSRTLGFAFLDEMPAGRLGALPRVPPFEGRTAANFRNLMEGEAGGTRTLLLDFYRDPLNPQAHETVAVFPEPDERLPDFALEPRGLSDRLLGHKGFVFDAGQAGDAHAAHLTERFAEHYTLDGKPEDEPALRRAFGPGTLEALAESHDWCARGAGGVLILSRPGHGCPPEERPEFLRQALHLRRLFRSPAAGQSEPALAALSGSRLSFRRAVLTGLVGLVGAVLAGHLVGACAGYIVGFLAGAAEGDPHAWTRTGMRVGAAVGRVALPVLMILGQGLVWWARRYQNPAAAEPAGEGPRPAPAVVRHGLLAAIIVAVVCLIVIPVALGIALGNAVAGWCLPLVKALGGDPDRWATPLTVTVAGVGGALGLVLPLVLYRRLRKAAARRREAGPEPPASR